jgi:hypothetical protein
MTKRQARIAREAERKLREQEKSARLRERVPEGGVRVGSDPPAKQARAGADPGSCYSMNMTWTADIADVQDVWSWGVNRQWTQQDWDQIILPKLHEWAKLTWGEIDQPSSSSGHKMHHNMNSDSICEEAQYRMVEIDRYSEVIFRFRLGNKRRLWGYRNVNTFEILWFDPTHQIYPVDPD